MARTLDAVIESLPPAERHEIEAQTNALIQQERTAAACEAPGPFRQRTSRSEEKESNMKENDDDLVRFQLDPANLPPLSEAQRAELAALEGTSDSGIDYSDTPALSDDFWGNAQRGRFYKASGAFERRGRRPNS